VKRDAAIVRIQLDQLHADGTLDRLKRPLYVFTGLQFEQQSNLWTAT
jgi:hypothetical protein